MLSDKYVYCAFYDGVCKAMVVDIPLDNHRFVAESVRDWILDGATVKHLPLKEAKEAFQP